MNEKKGGCLKYFLIIVLSVAILSALSNSCSSNRYRGNSASSAVSTPAVTQYGIKTKTSQPSTAQFGEDAGKIVEDLKVSMGNNYKFSWMASGYKFSFTVKILDLSSNDLADLYAADSYGTQDIIDQLNESMKSANSSTVERFKSLGYAAPTVVFTMITSDDMEICSVENGEITSSITKDNFRYG